MASKMTLAKQLARVHLTKNRELHTEDKVLAWAYHFYDKYTVDQLLNLLGKPTQYFFGPKRKPDPSSTP